MLRSDEELMLAYAAGDIQAFDELYGRYRGPLYRYVLRLSRDETLANDLYQGCWEKVIRHRDRYRSAAPFRAWMYRLAHNHVVDHFRKRELDGGADPDDQVADLPDPSESTDRAQRESRLEKAVAALPADQQRTLLLRLECGLGLDEIADATGVARETAKSRLRYAVGKLKRRLASNGVSSGGGRMTRTNDANQ